jgi:hypothetical protein
VMTSFWDVGILVAGPVGGAIAGSTSYPLAFTTAAVIALLSLTVITVVLRARPRSGAPSRSGATVSSSAVSS